MTDVEKLQLIRRELLETLQALDTAAFLAASGKDIVVPLDNNLARIARDLFDAELVFSGDNPMDIPQMRLIPIEV